MPALEWQLDTSFGFPVRIGLNSVIESFTYSHRRISLFIEAEDFTEQNLKKVFTSLASHFTQPQDLRISAHSDKSVFAQDVTPRGLNIMCVHPDGSPESRRAARNRALLYGPRRSGYFHAKYNRFSDGREQMEYNPKADQEHVRQIDLKAPTPTYTGGMKSDLVLAIDSWDFERAKTIIALMKNVNVIGKWSYPMLTLAAGNGQLEVVLALLDKGADVNSKTEQGWTPLMSAAGDGGVDVVQLLADKGADLSAEDADGNTALILAVLHRHKRVVQVLLAKGAEVDQRNTFGETALLSAAIIGYLEIIELLIAQGADVNVRDIKDQTALMYASLAGHLEIIELLASKGVDVNARDKNGQTALMWARHEGTVRALIHRGADIHAMDNEGSTALMRAIGRNDKEKVQVLIAAGAGPGSIEPAQQAVERELAKKESNTESRKENAYRTLAELYLRLGFKKEADETADQAFASLGSGWDAQLHGRMGFIHLESGNTEAALAEYQILQERANNVKDKAIREVYESWIRVLLKEIERIQDQSSK